MADIIDKTTTVFTHEVFQCIDTGHHLKVCFFSAESVERKVFGGLEDSKTRCACNLK